MAKEGTKAHNIAFGTAVRTRRETLNLSMRALAKELGVFHSVVSQWENGQVSPTLDSVWLISAALNTTPSELLSVAEEAMEDDPEL